MSEFFSRFNVGALKFNAQVAACMLVIWIAVLGCAISNIWKHPFSNKQRWFWILWVVLLPGVGLLSYLPFSWNEPRPTNFLRNKKPGK